VTLPDSLLSCTLALVLDICIGDPVWFPHPVRGIGRLIQTLERLLYKSKHRCLCGSALLLFTVLITCSCVVLPLFATVRLGLGHYGQVAAAALLLWPTIALRDLFDHAEQVRIALGRDDLKQARLRLSFMVSRDTATLGESEVSRGCVESVSENLVDGIVSPLFFALLGGPVLAYAFKAVSTLDSMVGYRNDRYRHFGWASARTDDLLNFIPARLLFLTLPLSALFTRAAALRCFTTMLKDGGKSPSPNSGIPESGFAGALEVQLGGQSAYAGAITFKPLLNEHGRRAEANDIRRAQVLLIAGTLVSFCLLACLRVLLSEYNGY
jgi:adenosylcobinamide-phosphate synthase